MWVWLEVPAKWSNVAFSGVYRRVLTDHCDSGLFLSRPQISSKKKNVRKYLALNVIRGRRIEEKVKVERFVPINVRSVHSAVLADVVWLKSRARWRRACRHCLENKARLTKLTAVVQPTRAAGSAFWREGSVGKI